MTTSPTPPALESETVLLDEKASSIGWFFINKYYDFYNLGIDNIFKIYQKSATLSHGSFPGFPGGSANKIFKAKGIDAIKLRYKNDEITNNNRIVITDAAFEVSMEKNILIVVFGEWAKGTPSYYHFTQTFLLTPGANNNTFDVANDVLRFTSYDQIDQTSAPPPTQVSLSEKMESEKPSIKPETKSQAVKAESTKPEPSKEPTKPEQKPDLTKSEATKVESPKVDSGKSDGKPEIKKLEGSKPVETKQDTPEVGDSDESKAASSTPSTPSGPKPQTTGSHSQETPSTSGSKSEAESNTASETGSSKLAAPLSWAALASQAAAVKPAKVAAPSPAPKPAPPKKITPAAPNGKFRKEEWFPIYIRGVRPIDEKNLKDHLSKTFGELKFFKTNLNIALVDFVTQEAQHKALETKEIEIDGVTISLEPRESKTGFNFHNNPKKQKDQKDVKRTRPEKKVATGKKNVSKKE
jgi:UBP3-associated protein BRE5